MKKIMLALFATMMVVGLVGCGDDAKRMDVHCDKDDAKCIEMSTEG